jgi:uncharacterized membrane protein YvbJ
MTESGQENDDNKQRNREIASNEEKRQTTSAIRVSVWAIVAAVIVAVIVVALVWSRLDR